MSIEHAARLRRSVPLTMVVIGIMMVTFVATTPASGESGGASTSTLANAGVLRLRLGAEDTFKWHLPAGTSYEATPFRTQSLGVSSGCRLALSGDPLVSFSVQPSNGSAGLFGDAIGVQVPGEGNGQPCGRIDAPNQVLAMQLGTALAGTVIDFAEIDVEGKFDAVLEVKGYFVNGSCPPSPGITPMASETYDMTAGGSDSGPDSADGDNYRSRFPKLAHGNTAVNCLVFKATAGATSLEGGADGTGACDAADGCSEPSLGQSLTTSDSLFHLVRADGLLDCGDIVSQTNGGITTTVERLDNADASDCVPIPYDQDSSTDTQVCNPNETNFLQCIFLRKDLSGQPEAQFYWTVTWAPEPGSYMEEETQFDFGNGFQALQLCRADGLAGGGADGNPDLPANGDPWCVVDTSTTHLIAQGPDGETLVEVTERYYGSGDPVGHR